MYKTALSPWIFVTNNCNLRCPYCWEEHVAKSMSPEIWNAVNNQYIHLKETGQADKITYRLSGGEPFTYFIEWKDYPLIQK